MIEAVLSDMVRMSSSNSITEEHRSLLLSLAKKSIQNGLLTGKPLPINVTDYPAELQQKRATFVTLQINGQLRGCIGTLEAERPLVLDVVKNAFAAAFNDPRFPALRDFEFDRLEYHISVLTPAEPMSFSSEQDLLSQIRPGIDGLIIQEGHHRGTFLPSVWESLPDRNDFLVHLKNKAGLPPFYWSDTLKVFRYTTESFPE